jgi:hypothetical protein
MAEPPTRDPGPQPSATRSPSPVAAVNGLELRLHRVGLDPIGDQLADIEQHAIVCKLCRASDEKGRLESYSDASIEELNGIVG